MTRKQYSFSKLGDSIQVYDFMRWSLIAFSFSTILLLASIMVIFIYGFNWGLDFTGGTIVELHLEQATNIDQIRQVIEQSGFTNAVVQNFGSSHDVIVRMPFITYDIEQRLKNIQLKLSNNINKQNVIVKRVEVVGPNVSHDLLQTSSIALLLAILCIFIYVVFRFEWRLATGTMLALIHDVVITLGLLSIFNIEIESTIIASLISVIGYSLNDSIVVSDRIRENFRIITSSNAYDIFNISITQVLNRTIMTSAITMIVILILIIFGGSMLRSFSITLFIGVLIGTISSIYVASALALKLGIKREHFIAAN